MSGSSSICRVTLATAMGIGSVLAGTGCSAVVPAHDPNAWRGSYPNWFDMDAIPNPIVHRIQLWHGASAFDRQTGDGRVLRAEFVVELRGRRVAGQLWTTADLGRVRVELTDGTVVGFDGQTVWGADPASDLRLHVRAWPWLLTLPFQLDGAMDRHEVVPDLPLEKGRRAVANEWTYRSADGEPIGNRHFAFADHPTGQLRAVGWVPSRRPAPWPLDRSGIVVFGQPKAIEGLKEDCVRLHRSWTFYDWNPTAGMGAARIGAGQVERVELVAPRAGLFERARGSVALDPSSVGY